MSDDVQREWRFYLEDMISFVEKVVDYTQNLDQDGFVTSGLNYDGARGAEALLEVFSQYG